MAPSTKRTIKQLLLISNRMEPHRWCNGKLRRVWRYQRGNQNPYIEEEQTTQWPKEKVQKNDLNVLASSVLDRGFKPRSVLASSVLDRGFKTDRFKLKTMKFVFSTSLLVVICTDCIGSCKSNYHTITTPTASYRYLISGYKCKQNDGKCKDNIQCIPLTRFCDTDSETYHCEDRSDKDPDICRSKCKIIYNIRDRPFNLQGFFFAQKFFFGQHELEFFFLAQCAIFFSPEFNIRLYVKNSESDFFFPPPKSEYFFRKKP